METRLAAVSLAGFLHGIFYRTRTLEQEEGKSFMAWGLGICRRWRGLLLYEDDYDCLLVDLTRQLVVAICIGGLGKQDG